MCPGRPPSPTQQIALTCDASANELLSCREYLRAVVLKSPISPYSRPGHPNQISRSQGGHSSILGGWIFLRAAHNRQSSESKVYPKRVLGHHVPMSAAIFATLQISPRRLHLFSLEKQRVAKNSTSCHSAHPIQAAQHHAALATGRAPCSLRAQSTVCLG